MNDMTLAERLMRPLEPMPPDRRFFIIAKNERQAVDAARNAGLSRHQWFYVSGERALRGRQRGITTWHVGAWADRRDIADIEACLRYLRAVEAAPDTAGAA
jgi:hypothetical protein